MIPMDVPQLGLSLADVQLNRLEELVYDEEGCSESILARRGDL